MKLNNKVALLRALMLNCGIIRTPYIPCFNKRPIKDTGWSPEFKNCLAPEQAVEYEDVDNNRQIAIRPIFHRLLFVDIDTKENPDVEKAAKKIIKKVGVKPVIHVVSSESGGAHIGYYFSKHKAKDRDRTPRQWGITYEIKSNRKYICCRGIAERYAKPFLKALDSGKIEKLPRAALNVLMPPRENWSAIEQGSEHERRQSRDGLSTYGSVERAIGDFPGIGARDDYLNNHLFFWRKKYLSAETDTDRQRYKQEAALLCRYAMRFADDSFTKEQIVEKFERVFLRGE